MRVLLISCSNLEYAVSLANGLSEKEDVEVKLLQAEDEITMYFRHSLDTILSKNIDSHLINFRRHRDIRNLPSVYRIIKYINDIKPDVIHVQEFGNLLVWLTLPFMRNFPFVATVHEPEPPLHRQALSKIRRYLVTILQKLFTKYYDKLIVHGEYLKTVAMTNFKRKEPDVQVIPHGEFSIFKKFANGPTAEQRNSILFFGRLNERKGFEYLIEAQPLITREIPDAKIIIAGKCDISGYKRVMKNTECFEIHDQFIPYEQVGEFFQKCSIVVLPYIEASQSGVVPVAYAYGKPVVVTNVGSLSEVVEHGITGLIVPPRDAEALAKAVIRLLNNDELRSEMGKNAYAKTKKELSWESIATKTVAVYKDAIKAHANR